MGRSWRFELRNIQKYIAMEPAMKLSGAVSEVTDGQVDMAVDDFLE
jgi:hypothetical protein